MSLPNILEGEGPSLTAGALLYTFSRSLVSLAETSQTQQQPDRAAVREGEQSGPVRQTLRRISSAEVALHHQPDSAWLIIKQKVAPWRKCSARVAVAGMHCHCHGLACPGQIPKCALCHAVGLRRDGFLGLSPWRTGHLALCRQRCDRRLLQLPQPCDLDPSEAVLYRNCCGKGSAASLCALFLV